MVLVIFLSFLSGVLVIVNIGFNGMVSHRIGKFENVFINFLVGTLVALLAALLISSDLAIHVQKTKLIFGLGGSLGVITTLIFNVLVRKLSALYMVLLRFIGQIGISIVIDAYYYSFFSPMKLLGCFLLLIGLFLFNYKKSEIA